MNNIFRCISLRSFIKSQSKSKVSSYYFSYDFSYYVSLIILFYNFLLVSLCMTTFIILRICYNSLFLNIKDSKCNSVFPPLYGTQVCECFVEYGWTYAKISRRRRDFLHRVDGRYIKTTTRQLLFTTTRNQQTRKHVSVAPKPVLLLSS